jgi:hypothetical protein
MICCSQNTNNTNISYYKKKKKKKQKTLRLVTVSERIKATVITRQEGN